MVEGLPTTALLGALSHVEFNEPPLYLGLGGLSRSGRDPRGPGGPAPPCRQIAGWRPPPPPSPPRATPEPQCGRVRRYKCDCDPGWSGANCDVNNDECASNPCVNGGTCKDMTGGYVCTCREGFSGEWQLLEQSGPGVGPGRSPRGAAALTAAPSPGPNCQTNVNECASSPCLNQGTCIDDVAGYTCNCLLPYTGEGGAWQGLGWPCLAGLPQGSALSLGPSPCRRHCRLSTQRRGVPGREFSVRRPPLLCLRSLSGR